MVLRCPRARPGHRVQARPERQPWCPGAPRDGVRHPSRPGGGRGPLGQDVAGHRQGGRRSRRHRAALDGAQGPCGDHRAAAARPLPASASRTEDGRQRRARRAVDRPRHAPRPRSPRRPAGAHELAGPRARVRAHGQGRRGPDGRGRRTRAPGRHAARTPYAGPGPVRPGGAVGQDGAPRRPHAHPAARRRDHASRPGRRRARGATRHPRGAGAPRALARPGGPPDEAGPALGGRADHGCLRHVRLRRGPPRRHPLVPPHVDGTPRDAARVRPPGGRRHVRPHGPRPPRDDPRVDGAQHVQRRHAERPRLRDARARRARRRSVDRAHPVSRRRHDAASRRPHRRLRGAAAGASLAARHALRDERGALRRARRRGHRRAVPPRRARGHPAPLRRAGHVRQRELPVHVASPRTQRQGARRSQCGLALLHLRRPRLRPRLRRDARGQEALPHPPHRRRAQGRRRGHAPPS